VLLHPTEHVLSAGQFARVAGVSGPGTGDMNFVQQFIAGERRTDVEPPWPPTPTIGSDCAKSREAAGDTNNHSNGHFPTGPTL